MTSKTDVSARPEVVGLVEKYLVCPRTHDALTVDGGMLTCANCGFRCCIEDNVVVVTPNESSFFDSTFEIMQQGHNERGENWRFCYERQVKLVESLFVPGQIVLDVGCGPLLPYTPAPGVFVIGLEPSLASIRANRQVNLAVCGTATAIPLATKSVDIVIGFYAVHHMVGESVKENDAILRQAFAELSRVIKPGGLLLIFEATPWKSTAAVQRLLWNITKRLMGDRLDMYFRSRKSIKQLAQETFPTAVGEEIDFEIGQLDWLSPIFSIPRLRIPKFLYPLQMRLYKWEFRAA